MGRLEGKVAFLTGAGAGIAKATSKAFAREGAKVALFELNAETGASAADRKSTRLNSSHSQQSRMPSSA